MEAILQQIDVTSLRRSPFNPRKDFDKTGLLELAASIKERGVLEPLLVRVISAALRKPLDPQGPPQYEIIAGERRWRAAANAGLETVPCIVRAVADEEAREIQIIENLQRADISPLEEAQGFQDLLKMANSQLPAQERGAPLDVAALAKKIGKSKEFVHHRLALLRLAPPARKALESGKISAGHAQELVALKPEQQEEMAKYAQGSDFMGTPSVQDLRQQIKYKYALKPKVSARELAARKKMAEQQKKQNAKWAAENKKNEAARELNRRVMVRACTELYPKLLTLDARDRFLDVVLIQASEDRNSMGEAVLLSQDKPLPDGYLPFDSKAFAKRSLKEKVALLMLAGAADAIEGYTPKPVVELLRWAKIDTKKIAKEIAAAEKAAKAPVPGEKKAASAAAEKQTAKAGKPTSARKISAKGKMARGKSKRKK